MRIIVLGATGMAGTAVVNEALSRGHEVTAVSRRRRHRAGAGVTSCLLDVTDVESVAGLLKDSDAAVVALRPPAGHESNLVRRRLSWTPPPGAERPCSSSGAQPH